MKRSWFKYLLIGMALFMAVFLGNMGVMVSNARLLTASSSEATGINLNAHDIKVSKGSTYQLKATVYPSWASKTVYWDSDNKGVATVDSNGLVTARSSGTATIKAFTPNGKTDTCKVTVLVYPNGLNIGVDTLKLNRGAEYQFKPTFSPTDVTETKLTWSSNYPNIVSVDQNGLATAVSAGEAVISATCVNGVTAKCLVTVEVFPNGLGANYDFIKMETGSQRKIVPVVVPSDATNKTVTYTSDKKSVAVVDSTGLVTAVSAGTANIKLSTWNGITKVIPVTVEILPTGLTLNPTTLQMVWGEEKTITPVVFPTNATNKTVTWSISDNKITGTKKIASVNGGKIKAWATGEVTVTAKTVNGITATCKVTVICDNNPANPYADARVGSWQYKAIEAISNKGYMEGKGNFAGRILFDPDSSINRSQLVTALYAIDGKPAVDYEALFYDVPPGMWYSLPITWAAKNNIVSGNPGGKFSITGPAVREQFALILYNYAKFKGYDVTQSADLSQYPDASKVDSWAYDAMSWAVGAGIISGKGSASEGYWLAPTTATTRVECAVMLNKFTDLYSGGPITLIDEEEPIALPVEEMEEEPAPSDDSEIIIDDEDEDVIDDEDKDVVDDEDEDVIDDEDEDVIDDEDKDVVDDEDEDVIDDEEEEVIDNEPEVIDNEDSDIVDEDADPEDAA